MRISNAVLARDPRNWDARRGAVDAAIAAGDRRQAEVLAAEGRTMAPTDSRATLLSARVARAFGSNIRAQTMLETAAAQRWEEKLGGMASVATTPTRSTANPFQATSTPVALYRTTTVFGDRVSREITQELTLVRNDTAPRALGSTDVRVRSGTAGLDQLQELSATAQASFQLGKLGGRMTTRVTPVFLDAGKLPTTGDPLLRFGTNAVNGASKSTSNTAAGAALNVAYQRGDFVSVDVGSRRWGFRSPTSWAASRLPRN